MSTLKIEADKFYRTRDGHKVWISLVLQDQETAWGIVAGRSSAQSWHLETGRFWTVSPTPHDLVAEWDFQTDGK